MSKIDHINHIMFYSFGEVLFDYFEDTKVLGGAAFNLAAHLSHLGSEVALVSAVGKDNDGKEIQEELKIRSIDSRYFQVIEGAPTGRVNVVVDSNGIPSYDILHPVAWDFIDCEIKPQINSYLVFGTLALRNSVSRHSLIRNLSKFSIRIFDVNLREPYYTPELVLQFLDQVELIKLNEDEWNLLCNIFSLSKEMLTEKLFLSGRLDMILITKGKEGAELINRKREHYSRSPQVVEVVDTVGCGDSFLAGFLHYYYTKKATIDEALEKAIKISAIVASQRGAMPNYIVV